MTLKSHNGKTMFALDVFSAAISFLKDHFMDSINSRNPGNNLRIDRVRWVLTVPAIWTDAAKQFMREAAEKTGIPRQNLMIALEPECASIYCQTKEVEDFQKSVANKSGSKYIVLDNGGGTVDVTVHEIINSGALKSLHMPTGGSWGGSKVNEQFEEYFEKLLTTGVAQRVKREKPEQWLRLMRDFEDIKTSLDELVQEYYTMELSTSILNIYKELIRKSINTDDSFEQRSQGAFIQGEETLKIPRSVVVNMIKKVSEDIRNHTSNLLHQCELEDVDFINLVGGFSNSQILRDRIQSLGIADVHAPEEAELAVLRGAVITGWYPKQIISRRSKITYGFDIAPLFDNRVHPLTLKFVDKVGKERCYLVFKTIVKVNDEIQVGDKVLHTLYPLTICQTSMEIGIYTSCKQEVKYCTENECIKIGSITVPMPLLTGGTKRKVEIEAFFGNSEFHVTAVDVTSGCSVNATYDFLSYD